MISFKLLLRILIELLQKETNYKVMREKNPKSLAAPRYPRTSQITKAIRPVFSWEYIRGIELISP